MNEPIVFVFVNKQRLVTEFSHYFQKLVGAASEPVRVALSGGNTPKSWFEDLSANHRNDIDWGRIHLYWGDERCVPPGDADSNFGMARKYLLDHVEIPDENVHRIKGELDPELAAAEYTDELHDLIDEDNIPVFDLVILGMGEDGHTASIFPDQLQLWDAPAWCTVATHPVSGQKRVSLTGKVINNASKVAFLVTGENKSGKVNAILNSGKESGSFPASLVKPVNGELVWFLDKDAAAALDFDQ